MTARRIFDDSCTLQGGQHIPGDRHVQPDGRVQEWTGSAWTAVCLECDKPMLGRDPQSWLACEFCGIRAYEVRAS